MAGGGDLRDKQNRSFIKEDGVWKQRVTSDDYSFTDSTSSGSYDYYGFVKADGTWLIKRLTASGDLSMRIATIDNNPTMISYTLAWAAYESLTYDKVEDL